MRVGQDSTAQATASISEEQHKSALALDDELKIYGAFRDYIKHEDNLTNNRLTWMLTVHGFLYAAYALSIQKKYEISQKVMSDAFGFNCDAHHIASKVSQTCREYFFGSVQAWPQFSRLELQMDWLTYLLSGVGLVISLLAFLSIWGAKIAIGRLQRSYERRFYGKRRRGVFLVTYTGGHIELPNICGGGSGLAKALGGSASLWIPFALMLGWAATLWFSFHINGGWPELVRMAKILKP